MRADYLISMVLFEDRMPVLQQKWANLDFSHDRAAVSAGHKPEDIVSHMASMVDPSPNKQYTDRALHWYSKKQFRLEDHGRVRRVLDTFHRVRQRMPVDAAAHHGVKNARDINSYKSVHDLEDALMPFEHEKTKSEVKATDRAVVDLGSKLLHKDDKVEVRRLHNSSRGKAAMMVLGRNTRWCTAAKEDNQFDNYASEGPLHFVHDKVENKKYLMHHESGQYMDEQDRDAESELTQLGNRHPVLHKVLHHDSLGPFFSDAVAKEKMEKHQSGVGRSPMPNISGYAERSRDPEMLDELSQHPYAQGLKVAQNPHAAEHTLQRLASVEPHAVAMNPKASAQVLHTAAMKLHGDETTSAVASRRRIVTHPNAGPETIDHLIKHMDASEYQANSHKAAANKNTSATTLHHIVDRAPGPRPSSGFIPKEASLAVRHPNASAEVLDLADQKYGKHFLGLRDDIARHPNAASHTLDRIARDEYRHNAVRNTLFRHPNLSKETEHGLHTHFGELTKSGYAPNPNYQGVRR